MAIRKIISRSIGVDVIAAEDLAAGSVETAEIQNGAVTGPKLADNLNYDSGTLYLDSTNNRVGIGTTSPGQLLHVSSSGATSNGIRISNSEGSFDARVDGGEFYLYDVDDARIPFLIDSSGKVGIGTSLPSEYFTVLSGGSTPYESAGFYRDYTGAGYGANYLYLGRKDSSGNLVAGLRIDGGGDENAVGSHNGYFSINIRKSGTFVPLLQSVGGNNLVFNEGGDDIDFRFESDTSTHALFLEGSSGNVGIGTSTPAEKLTVSGNIRMSLGQLEFNDASVNIAIPAANTMSFDTSGTERMRISSNGAVGINSNSINTMLYINSSTAVSTSNAGLTNFVDQTDRVSNYRYHNASGFTSYISLLYTNRSQNSAYNFMVMGSGGASDIEFSFRGDGQAYADGSWNGGGADYAEYFEWADGNTTNEDRRGYTVVLDGNMIRKATDEDDASQIIGAVSATPCVIGDHADNKWSDKYLKDDFGNYLYDEHNAIEWTEIITDEEGNETEKRHSYEDWRLPVGIEVPDDATVLTHDVKGNRLKHRRLNPDFDSDVEYITRENRPEWTPIGMMGKLRIRKGQPMGDRWIKMRDVSETVEEWLVR